MLNFGFSAFLKLISMNEKPHRTEVRKRVTPSLGGGYDFHQSLRRLARRYLVSGEPIEDVLASAETIIKAPERLSAIGALERLDTWRGSATGAIVSVSPVTFESPGRLFRVKFEADFGLRISANTAAIHIWNTKRPVLAPGPTYAALALIAQAFELHDDAPNDIGVLSLREPTRLYRLSDVADPSTLASSMVDQLEETIRRATPPPPSPDHPSPPL